MKSFGLYIHIPYCIHKCGYCDFNSHLIDSDQMDYYVQALLKEIEHYKSRIPVAQKIDSVFLGGGTPTTLSPSHLESLLNSALINFNLCSNPEVTIEANPASVSLEALKNIRKAGFNRISVGSQSFIQEELNFLERSHGPEEIFESVQQAREAGFENLSMDLMFAFPGQSATQWGYSLSQVLKFHPEHISTYNLTIEPGTAFFKYHQLGKLNMPNDDVQLELFRQSIQTLTEGGYTHYEISNFARPGYECKHNLNYWENGEFLGLGAGASSHIEGTRFKNLDSPSKYIESVSKIGTAVEFKEHPSQETSMGESMMLGLRLTRGIDLKQFETRYKKPFRNVYGSVLDALMNQNLVKVQNERIALTPKGLNLADSVILEFIS